MGTERVLSDVRCALALVGAAAVLSAAANAAGPPPNDLRSNATVVGALPFTETILDTTGATTSPDDPSPCANGTAQSVWYRYTATADTQLVVDTLGSGYRTGVVIVYDADPTVLSCGQGSAVFTMGAGVSVSIMVSALGFPSSGPLVVSIYGSVPPANDVIGAARTIPALPFADTVDTTTATTDADDAQADGTCGFFLRHSIWYRFTAGPADSSLLVDNQDINVPQDVGIIIATGAPGALTNVACGQRSLAAHVTPGSTYYVLIDGSIGRVPVRASQAPPEPSFALSVDDRGSIDRSGAATFTGTYNCFGDFATGFALVAQRKGAHDLPSGGFTLTGLLTCDGTPRSFRATATPFPVRLLPDGASVYTPFVPGTVIVTPSATVCSAWGCPQFNLPGTEAVLSR